MASLITPLLSVAPTRALVDEKFKVRVKNLPAGLPFTLHSLHLSEDNDYWEAFGHYISNYNGTVCVSEHLSLGGTYTGKEPMGLLWSLRPVPGSRKGLRLRKKNVSSPLLYTISVYSGHLTEGFRDQAPLASVVTERWYMAPGVQRISIKENIVRGTMFLPPGPGPFPGLLDMWGGGGGLVEYRAAILASHGYAAFALEYINPGEMATAELEIEYFETAFNIVKDHPRVIPNKVGIFGLSFGATVAFYLASESNVVKPRCCVCINGHTIFSRGKSFAEQSGEMLRNAHLIRIDEDDNHMWRNLFLSRDNTLDMEKINCPVLLVCGEDDQNVPSVEIADDIERTMHAAGKGHLLTRINYPGAGHLIEVPYAPHFRVTAFMQSRTQKIMMLWGGQTKPHSDAQEDSWKKILDYLEHHLFSSPSLESKL
ncbi:peroxisomal succinyl-coenzyme A thioesterase-like [Periophthalmus magnuspinnatus]|uniref:peroxisomal succinyl-coenzyme A thioesterase-like n=1 Tax=Periophthalmus magnuspinnatus TaxID=409849 RepID=UPI00145AED12|nr:peroxisomal succinyl-coenzyme A thioesterase-like [Periophthalmus magnuspinnatus]XP_033846217.1 peroxisomal succinyl-coenzyme A thioesterase-like [Periophthalmus magnuspinnatus]XP_055087530.1 peroxisomal succinyl-coenzyme A thioesterase-like [Periophthalmus magnuspinnatus]XP_055087531.1 peroxisomal succinyl-coenzyme A thioesterase-like [Periophthalmus magnuspinnatus]